MFTVVSSSGMRKKLKLSIQRPRASRACLSLCKLSITLLVLPSFCIHVVDSINFFNLSDQKNLAWRLSLACSEFLGKSQPGCSYKVCSYLKKSVC